MHQRFPRAFDVVSGDALYTDPRVYEWAEDHGKEVPSVLKDDRRDLLKDVYGLVEVVPAVENTKGKTHRRRCDLQDLTSWPQVERPVRVVRSIETTPVRRQHTDEVKDQVSKWISVMTRSPDRAPLVAVVDLGHARWEIENRGFNETTNRWAADHVYKHHPVAMAGLWILCMLAHNVFHALFWRNLKAAYRVRITMLHLSRILAATMYSGLPKPRCQSP